MRHHQLRLTRSNLVIHVNRHDDFGLPLGYGIRVRRRDSLGGGPISLNVQTPCLHFVVSLAFPQWLVVRTPHRATSLRATQCARTTRAIFPTIFKCCALSTRRSGRTVQPRREGSVNTGSRQQFLWLLHDRDWRDGSTATRTHPIRHASCVLGP